MADLTSPQPNWAIRPFQRGDGPAVRRLIESVWHEHFHGHADPFVRDFIYSRLSDVDKAESTYVDQSLFLCATSQNTIIGSGAIKPCDDRECEVVRMFVAKAYRGRGIARAVADRLITFAQNAGYRRIRLSSNNALVASHHLYERMGFEPADPWEAGGDTHSRYYALRI